MTAQDSHYIAVSLTDIVAARLPLRDEEERSQLCRLARQMATYYSLHFRKRSESLKGLYRYFNPAAPQGQPRVDDGERAALKTEFFDQMASLLTAANYTELSMEDVQNAMDEQAPG